MRAPGSHVDMLGLYIANGEQHFDHQTLQDHISPHASSTCSSRERYDRGS